MKQAAFALLTAYAAQGCTPALTPAAAAAALEPARQAYGRASAGPGAELAPAALRMARRDLDAAERAAAAAAPPAEVADLAYVAQRRAQIAEAVASQALAARQQARVDAAAAPAPPPPLSPPEVWPHRVNN